MQQKWCLLLSSSPALSKKGQEERGMLLTRCCISAMIGWSSIGGLSVHAVILSLPITIATVSLGLRSSDRVLSNTSSIICGLPKSTSSFWSILISTSAHVHRPPLHGVLQCLATILVAHHVTNISILLVVMQFWATDTQNLYMQKLCKRSPHLFFASSKVQMMIFSITAAMHY